MPEATTFRALVFDAYGTLYDVHSIGTACESLFPGKGNELSRLWRTKQLEYSWLRSLMGRYMDFERITGDALAYSCAALGLTLRSADAIALMDAYRHLAPHADARAVLASLGKYKRAILSNGSPGMLEALVANTGLAGDLDAVLSVDSLGIFKPHPSVYEFACRKLGVAAAEVGFVSSNFWDVCGATAFGFRTFWINRANARPDELGLRPYRILESLDQLAACLD